MYATKVCDAGKEAQCWTPMPVDGVISKLYVSVDNDPDANDKAWRVTVRKNGTNQAVFCDLIGQGTFSCQDLTHSVSFSAGDLFSVGIDVTPGYGKPNVTTLRYTALYTGN
jgi:hypothetical protein